MWFVYERGAIQLKPALDFAPSAQGMVVARANIGYDGRRCRFRKATAAARRDPLKLCDRRPSASLLKACCAPS
jgi:hypothetical protein